MNHVTVKNSETLIKKRDDPRVYLPTKFNASKYGAITWCKLSKMADTPPSTVTPSRNPEKWYNYIDLADIEEVEGKITQVHKKQGKDINGGKVLMKNNDVIFARIEPSIFNRKYAIVPVEIDECVGSTEIYIARPKKGVSSIYLHWALRGEWIADQLNPGILRGSTGRRRLKREDFADLLIPDISIEDQKKIEAIINTGNQEKSKLLMRVENVMAKAQQEAIDLLSICDLFTEIEEDETEEVGE